MRILLVNPPNSGRSIPEERYGITSLKRILRGEPLGLETLAGNLPGHDVALVDLKADAEGLDQALAAFSPELVGITAMTCEANAALAIARRVKARTGAGVVVGGVHASNDPGYFNREEVDYVCVGLGKGSMRELADQLAKGEAGEVPGIGRTGRNFRVPPRAYAAADLVDEAPPAYHLADPYRDRYFLPDLGVAMGFVETASGCTHACNFCCVPALTGGKYFVHDLEAVVRDVRAQPAGVVVRLVDANTFGDVARATALADRLAAEGLARPYIADARADTIVRHPELFARWKAVGLRALVIGFEEIDQARLAAMDKRAAADANGEALRILADLGINVIGDFIVSPDYTEAEFDALERYLEEHRVGLPMITVMTPLPGTPQYEAGRHRITQTNLDYYTLTNAVWPTAMEERAFYERYASLMARGHAKPKV